MTVREAFDKAGFPMERIFRFCHPANVYGVRDLETFRFDSVQKRWVFSWFTAQLILTTNEITDLPAKDALEVLPEPVRKVVEEA